MCPETKGRSLEDINAQFGEQVAIKFYGATEQEKKELEEAAERDELEEKGDNGKSAAVQTQHVQVV
jgi:hypothetical protein